MSLENDVMNQFNEYSDESLEKILANLMNDENIELKTEINNVPSIAILSVLSEYFKEKGLAKSNELIENYVKKYLKFMVSSNRKGRLEIIDAVKGMVSSFRLTVKDRLTSDLKDL